VEQNRPVHREESSHQATLRPRRPEAARLGRDRTYVGAAWLHCNTAAPGGLRPRRRGGISARKKTCLRGGSMVQLGAFLRTTLPLDLSGLPELDSGRYHSLWLPDHMVSFWPDSIWTPEFTDLATASPSPHRYLDSMAVAAAVAVRTERIPI